MELSRIGTAFNRSNGWDLVLEWPEFAETMRAL